MHSPAQSRDPSARCAQAMCEAADLKESYDVRWGVFVSQETPATLGDIPFPVHPDDAHLLLDVLLWGAQVCCCGRCRGRLSVQLA